MHIPAELGNGSFDVLDSLEYAGEREPIQIAAMVSLEESCLSSVHLPPFAPFFSGLDSTNKLVDLPLYTLNIQSSNNAIHLTRYIANGPIHSYLYSQ